jgi:hypothetical protein
MAGGLGFRCILDRSASVAATLTSLTLILPLAAIVIVIMVKVDSPSVWIDALLMLALLMIGASLILSLLV